MVLECARAQLCGHLRKAYRGMALVVYRLGKEDFTAWVQHRSESSVVDGQLRGTIRV